MNEKLELKNKMKAKKPNFVRQDTNKKIFKNKWRKPRGLHNKRRLNKAGHQKNPSVGYGSPKEVKNLHKSGLELILINNIKELQKIKNENQAAVLASTLGKKSKVQILEICLKEKIKVFNVKDIQKYITESKEALEQRKKEKKKRETKKKEAKEKAEKKAEEKKPEETKEDKQEEIKEQVLDAKQEPKQMKPKDLSKQDLTQAKSRHLASSVPEK